MTLNEMKPFLHGERDAWEQNDTSSYSGSFCVPVTWKRVHEHRTARMYTIGCVCVSEYADLVFIPGLRDARKGSEDR
jgi:hypothetical protein